MKRLNQTECPIFVIVSVFFFYFQRQSFFTFILDKRVTFGFTDSSWKHAYIILAPLTPTFI